MPNGIDRRMARPAFGALAVLIFKPLASQESIMSIGIIGSGALGSNLARALAKKGISATISNSRGPESLASLVQELGPSIKAGTVEEAAGAGRLFHGAGL